MDIETPVVFCKKCVISNQRPSSVVEFNKDSINKKQTIMMDDQGVCSACNFAEKKNKNIDWEKREQELITLCDKYRSRNGSYDCVIPGSGGKDSAFTSHVLKYKYNMNPLTVTWAPHEYTEIGWQNFQRWIEIGGFDNVLITPNGRVHRLLTKLAFLKLQFISCDDSKVAPAKLHSEKSMLANAQPEKSAPVKSWPDKSSFIIAFVILSSARISSTFFMGS